MAKDISVKINFIGDVNSAVSSIERIQNKLNTLKIKDSVGQDLKRTLDQIAKKRDELAELSKKETFNKTDLQNIKNINSELETLEKRYLEYARMASRGAISTNDVNALKTLSEAFNDYDKKIKDSQKSIKNLTDENKKLNQLQTDIGNKITKQKNYDELKSKGAENLTAEYNKYKAVLDDIEIKQDKIARQLILQQQVQERINNLNSNFESKGSKLRVGERNGKYELITKEGQGNIYGGKSTARGELNEINQLHVSAANVEELSKALQELNNLYEQTSQKAKELEEILKSKNTGYSVQELTDKFEKNKQAIDTNTKQIEELVNKCEELNSVELGNLKQQIKDLSGKDATDWDVNQIKNFFSDYKKSAEDSTRAFLNLNEEQDNIVRGNKNVESSMRSATGAIRDQADAERNLNDITNRLTSFFSLASGIQILKRSVKDAVSTIKELDSVMTQAAVVTSYDVNDMWEKLPQFTDQANKLGVATKEAYSAMTLYVQQGLDLNTATRLATETLKMARIASLDASTATDRVTNAIRGFNMEISEDSAKRVADVYSNLAAKSASNVNELSTAMTKVASIASSANMSFENTAAFLAQGIETTRESAETIGTMLKTVIGRIGEVKKLYSEGELAGTDENGEAIDVNKISKAFRTAGINLNEFFLGQKGLDELLIELASRWDTLSLVQQRYIATMAAGSRQQSRFIALLQDYGRTQELITYAQDAAGASNEQYEKTLDSLESKMNQLKNAWDSFTMGIANNKLVKGGVDALTSFLTVINALTSKLGPTGGLVAKLAMAFGGFFGGGKLVKGFFSSFAEMFTTKKGIEGAKEAATGFGRSFLAGFGNIFKKEGWQNVSNAFQNLDWKFISATLQKNFPKFSELLTGAESEEDFKKRLSVYSDFSIEGVSAITVGNGPRISREEYEAFQKGFDEIFKSKDYLLFDSQIKGVQQLASMFSLATVALGGFAKAAEAAGNTKLASALTTISSVTGVLIPVLLALPPAITAIDKALEATGIKVSAFLPQILAITLAIAAVIAIIKIVSDLTENAKEKTESLKNAYAGASQAAENAKKAFDDLKTSLENYNSAQESIKKLAAGTNEFKEALIESNAEVLKLLETYPELAEYLQRDSNGVLSFTNKGLRELEDKVQTQAMNSQAATLNLQVAINKDSIKNAESVLNSTFANVTAPLAGQVAPGTLGYAARGVFENAYKNWSETGGSRESLYSAISDAFEDNLLYVSEAQIRNMVTAYETYNQKAAQNDLVNENLISNAVGVALSGLGVDSKYSGAMASLYARDNADELANRLEENARSLTGNENELREQFKNYYNSETDLTGNDLKRAVAAIEIAQEQRNEIKDSVAAFDKFAESNTEAADKLADVFSGTSTEDFLSKYIDVNDISDLAKQFGANEDELIALASSLGYADDKLSEFTSQINNTVAAQKKSNAQQRLSLQTRLAMQNGTGTFESGNRYLSDVIGKLSIQEVEIASNVFDYLDEVLAGGFSSKLTESFTRLLSGKDFSAEDIDWLQDWNPTNAVNAADTLRKKIAEITDEEGNALAGKQRLLDFYNELSKDASISLKEQTEQVYNELSEELDKLLEKGKNIDVDAIKDLATEGSNLEKILRQTGVTASGLARIFNAVKTGGINSFDGINDQVIKAVSSIKSVDEVLKETFDRLSGFSALDRGEGMDTLKSASDKVKEYIENYEYGNAADYLQEFYGAWYKEAVGDKTGDELNKALYDLGSTMQNLTSNDGYNAFLKAFQNGGAMKDLFGLNVGANSVDFDLDKIKQEGSTLQDIAKELAKNLKISDDAAIAIMGAFTAHNADLRAVLDENNAKKSLEEIEENSILSDQNIKLLAAALNQTEDEIKEQLEDRGVKFIKLFKEDGLRQAGKDIEQQLYSLGDKYKEIFNFTPEDGFLTSSMDEIVSQLSGLGLDEEQIAGTINAAIERVDGQKLTAKLWTGEGFEEGFEEFEFSTYEAYKEAVEKAQKEADATIFSDVLVEQLKEGFNNFDWTEIGTKIGQAIKNAIESTDEAEIQTDGSKLTDLDSQIQTTKSLLEELNRIRVTPGIDSSSLNTVISQIKEVEARLSGLNQQKAQVVAAVQSVGIFPHFASGGVAPYTGPALTGELGPEAVVRGDQWFTVGNQGPEIANLKKGDIVFNAKQTRDLLTKGRTSTRGRAYASGTNSGTGYWKLNDPVPNPYGASNTNSSNAAKSAASAASAASSAKDAAKVWLNTLDKLYNLVELIEEETRRRELLERQFERIQRNQNQTLIEIRDNYEAQLDSLDLQLAYQKELQKGRLAQINDVANERYKMGDSITTYAGSGATRYARYNQSTNTIQIDWDAINAITDEDLGNAVEAYIKRLEELQGQYEDTYKVICDIEDEIYDLQQAYREAYTEFGNRVHDALVKSKQDQIDGLKDFSDALSNEQSLILDALNEQIELERRIRDNTEKESEIADKEQQLAYLRRDTSSGNQKAIQQLEKEISDLRDDYRDTLIDQKLDELSNENEKAQAAREKQIELLQAQLDYDKDHGAFWSIVESLITSAFNPDGTMNASSDLVRLLQDTDGFKALSDIAQDSWMLDLAAAFQMSAKGLENWKVSSLTTQAIANGASITTADGSVLTYNKSTGKWEAGDSQYDISYNAQTGQYSAINGEKIPSSASQDVTSPSAAAAAEPATTQAQKTNRTFNDDIARGIAAAIWVFNDTGSGWDYDGVRLTQKFGAGARARVQQIINAQGPNGQLYNYWASRGYDALAEYRYSAFKTGGLADYTGFAWLDGTKTNPEVVLDAEDARNFIQLRDVLRNLGSSNTLGSETHIDVQINVDEIGSDYDVERLADKVKEEIYKNAQYRNVNALNFIR